MNLPGDPPNDRRSVPRHIRDGEHDSYEETLTGVPGRGSQSQRSWLWLAAIGVVAVAIGLWLAFR